MKRDRFETSRFPQTKLWTLPTGFGYENSPSLVARQIWYYVANLGEATWPPGFRYEHLEPKQNHEEGCLVHFILEGELSHTLRDRAHVVRKNEAILLDLQEPVSYENKTSHPVQFFWMTFDGRGMRQALDELDAHTQPVFRGLDRRRLVGIFHGLFKDIAAEPRGYEASVSALLGNLLAELFAVRALSAKSGNAPLHPLSASVPVRKVLACMTRYYYRTWSLKELSARTGQSVSHLSHAFKRETGYSPKQYLNRYRIEHAKTLLAETQASVEEIAKSVGIINTKYFARLFGQINGVSPRSYRARSASRTR